MFPIDPTSVELDDRGLFLVQDPYLRSRILPLFAFDTEEPERRVLGHGTAFRIDPFGQCASAFHVIEDFVDCDSEGATLLPKSSARLAALEFNGIGYGIGRIPEDAWRPIERLHSTEVVELPPWGPARIKNRSELLSLRIPPARYRRTGAPHLPVSLRGWPKVGDRVMAIGFPDLDRPRAGDDADHRPIVQEVFGGMGRISAIEPVNLENTRAWPFIRVEADWPSGMSGGPVFNEAGNVIGIVSTGMGASADGHPAYGTAVFLAGWGGISERVFESLDPSNPGWFNVYGVFDDAGTLVEWRETRELIECRAASLGMSNIQPTSIKMGDE